MRPPRTDAGGYADVTPFATSFRVYSPSEIRTSRPRPSIVMPPPLADELTPQKLARMFGIGFAALLAAFVAFLVIGNLTDDARHVSGAHATTALAAAPPPPPPEPAPVYVAPAPTVVEVPANDFEIPDVTPPARSATKAKGKQNKRRIVRTN